MGATIARASASISAKIPSTFSGLTNFPLRVNKQTSGTTAYRHGETVAPTASDIALGQVNLTPNKLSVFTKVSEEDVKFTTPAVDQIIMNDHMQRLALKSDLDFFEGSGASNTPLGIINWGGVSNTNVNGGTPANATWDDLITLEGVLEDANALVDDGSLAYVARPDVFRPIKTAAPSNAYTFGPSAYRINEGVNRFGAPWPVHTTTQLTTNLSSPSGGDYLFFARWSDTVHALWGGMEIKRSNIASDGTDHGFVQDLMFVKVSMWDDVAVIRSSSIAYANDVAN